MTAPPRRRDLTTAIGHVGRSVVAGTGAGGSHDDHLRRLITADGEAWASNDRGYVSRTWPEVAATYDGEFAVVVRRLVPKTWNAKGPCSGSVLVGLSPKNFTRHPDGFVHDARIIVQPYDPDQPRPAWFTNAHHVPQNYPANYGDPITLPVDLLRGVPYVRYSIRWPAGFPCTVRISSLIRPL